MIALVDTLGPAIWRASWQAAALALLVVLLVRCFGERLSPRWRFLLWGVVLTRLLFVVTPGSPWSVFNLAYWNSETSVLSTTKHTADGASKPVSHAGDPTTGPQETTVEPPVVADFAPDAFRAKVNKATDESAVSSGFVQGATTYSKSLFDAVFITRILSSLWLAGCVLMGLR